MLEKVYQLYRSTVHYLHVICVFKELLVPVIITPFYTEVKQDTCFIELGSTRDLPRSLFFVQYSPFVFLWITLTCSAKVEGCRVFARSTSCHVTTRLPNGGCTWFGSFKGHPHWQHFIFWGVFDVDTLMIHFIKCKGLSTQEVLQRCFSVIRLTF